MKIDNEVNPYKELAIDCGTKDDDEPFSYQS